MDRDDFESWLLSIDQYLSEMHSFEPMNSEQLNFTPESLGILEASILEKFKDINEILKNKNKKYLNACSVYVGETFRKNLGGKWSIELDDTKDVYYKLPTLQIPKAGLECPVTLVTACLSRRTGHYIEKVFYAMQRRTNS